MKNRLGRLERVVAEIGGRVCQVCHGYPFSTITVLYDEKPNRPGLYPTGECYLTEGLEPRVADDLRCRGCGVETRQTHLCMLVLDDERPTGRRVQLAGFPAAPETN